MANGPIRRAAFPVPKATATGAVAEQLYVPEMLPVVNRGDVLMTRPWLEWARRVTGLAGTTGGGGTAPGDVTGPASAVADDLAYFSGATGKVIADAGIKRQDVVVTTDPRLVNAARKDQANTFTSTQTIQAAAPDLMFVETDQPADQKRWQIIPSGRTLYLSQLTDALGVQQQWAFNGATGTFAAAGALFEQNRTTALGAWIAIPFNAANFGAVTGAWTVTAGQLLGAKYTLVGKVCTLALYVSGSSLSALTQYVYVTLPSGLTTVGTQGMAAPFFNNGVAGVGIAQVAPTNPNVVYVYRDIAASIGWAAGALSVAFTISFQMV